MKIDLNENQESTWDVYTAYIKKCIIEKNFKEAEVFVGKIKHPELAFTSSDFPLYLALLYACIKDFQMALESLKKAHEHGYKGFWRFAPDSCGWSCTTSEEYLLLEPLHKNDMLQSYVRKVYTGKVKPWGFDLSATPLCWFEKTELKRKNVRCYLTKQKLQKGELVYAFKFFNGSYDIPSEFEYAHVEAFENNSEAKENLYKYTTNNYKLSDYAFKIGYDHPLINFFWHNLEAFDLLKTLKLIANPPVNSTPYLAYSFNEKPLREDGKKIEQALNYGTGGEFLSLLYVLVKCGYLQDIISLLPQLPEHFPYLFLFFNSAVIYEKISDYLEEDVNELSNLIKIALKSYSKKSPGEVLQIASYGKSHPRFLKSLSICLNNYECHLYSNYQPGVNCFFQEFSQFERAKGGGLVDFFITSPELLPALLQMKSEECYLHGISDAYDNSSMFLYRAIVLNAAYEKSKSLERWSELPEYIRESEYHLSFKKVHKKTLKDITIIAKKL